MDESTYPEIVSVDEWIKAAHRGDAGFVLDRLRRGIDVDARGMVRNTALMAAVSGGRLDVIRILLEHGADLTLENRFGFTPVTHGVLRSRPWGAAEPDSGPLELLLAAGGRYRLCEAVLLNDVELARARLDEGDDPNANRYTYYGPLLMLAAVRGYPEIVALLLDRGADVEAMDDAGQRPLLSAARLGRTEVARLLIDRGAEIDAVGWSGQSALANAAIEGHRDLVDLLLARGAKRGVVDAMAMNDMPLFEALLDEKLREMGPMDEERRKKVDCLSDSHFRLAMVAAGRADAAAIRILLDRGAIHFHETFDSHSLLAEAARFGRVDTVRLLVDRGADLHAIGHDGLTPMQWAVQEGQTEVAALLRRAGALH